MKKKFLVFSPPYDETSGGSIVLHKLCSLLNDLGYESHLYPYFSSFEISKKNLFSTGFKVLKSLISSNLKPFRTNPFFTTPIHTEKDPKGWREWIVIYPETVFGNPLNATNVVRWLLHQPGFHTGTIYYGKNELYYKFNNAIKDFHFSGSTLSKNYLKVVHYPLEYYNTDNIPKPKKGIAYCIRKGQGKKIVHDVKNAICIDGKSHKETAAILKKSKTFISYDLYTAYSIFAVLCGCESVVIPDDDVSIECWYPNEEDRYGIAYGFSQLKESEITADLVRQRVIDEQENSTQNVRVFAAEALAYFQTTDHS